MARTTKLVTLFAAIVAVAAPAGAFAGTATGSFTVQATVAPSCTISGSTLTFPNYDPNSATPDDGATTLSLTCTKNTGYSVALTSANSFAMKNGVDSLNYVLYSDSGRTTVWNGSAPVAGTAANRNAITLNVYGRIAINQDVPTGTPSGGVSSPLTYSDTVTATVSF